MKTPDHYVLLTATSTLFLFLAGCATTKPSPTPVQQRFVVCECCGGHVDAEMLSIIQLNKDMFECRDSTVSFSDPGCYECIIAKRSCAISLLLNPQDKAFEDPSSHGPLTHKSGRNLHDLIDLNREYLFYLGWVTELYVDDYNEVFKSLPGFERSSIAVWDSWPELTSGVENGSSVFIVRPPPKPLPPQIPAENIMLQRLLECPRCGTAANLKACLATNYLLNKPEPVSPPKHYSGPEDPLICHLAHLHDLMYKEQLSLRLFPPEWIKHSRLGVAQKLNEITLAYRFHRHCINELYKAKYEESFSRVSRALKINLLIDL